MNMNLTSAPRYEYKSFFVMPFERNFDFTKNQKWMGQNWYISLYFITAYLLFLYYGQKFMSKRPKFEITRPLIMWNAFLAIFSIIGSIRTIPEFLYVLMGHGFEFSVCVPSYPQVNKVFGFWTWLFILSKVPELVDTIFIVLRKQKLIFLHWYHHILTALYCWYTYEEYCAFNRYFVTMNFSVHAVMYSYYCLRALRVNIPRWLAMSITSSQIVQMILGSIVCTYAFYKRMTLQPCYVSAHTATLSLLMYFSYLILFINFFVRSYFFSDPKSRHMRKQKKIDNKVN